MNQYSFDAARARDGLVAAIRALAARQGFTRVVLGVSGGKDTPSARRCAPGPWGRKTCTA